MSKKISMVLAVIVGMGMVLCASASAADNQTFDIYLEIQLKGKGVEYTRDNATDTDSPYVVEKHKIDKGATLYIEIDRTEDENNVEKVIYDAADNETNWKTPDDSYQGCAKVTEDGYIVQIGHDLYIAEDGIAIRGKAISEVTLKEKEGKETQGKLKMLGGTYWGCNDDIKIEEDDAHIKRAGSLKIKGKVVLFADLPGDVQDIFEPPAPVEPEPELK